MGLCCGDHGFFSAFTPRSNRFPNWWCCSSTTRSTTIVLFLKSSSSFSPSPSSSFRRITGKHDLQRPGGRLQFLFSCSKPAQRSRAVPQSKRSDEEFSFDGNNGRSKSDQFDEDDEPTPTVIRQGNSATIFASCLVGLLTGIGVVIFNNAVHDIRGLCWGGIPNRGAAWLREEPAAVIWKQVVLVPAFGGLVVGMLNFLQGALEVPIEGALTSNVKGAVKPILRAVAACVTLGTGNSLGPEGPSVEIGSSIAAGVGNLFDRTAQSKISLKAAGSAAGIASGFNAAVAGCFFAIESVLWPAPVDSSLSLTNTTSTVILSAVIASVVSAIGLGSEPAFTVPGYDFRSPSELPLYLLLGVLCGLVSLILTWCTSFMVLGFDNVQKNLGMPKVAFPVFGGFTVGLIALAYPEILYWGFENVDVLLESQPFVTSLSADLLLQLVAVKIVATSLCRASGLVGGYYAPSLFIGAATGMMYGKFVNFVMSQPNALFHLSTFEVASPQAYGLVGMAATLAGVCQVPLTAVLLLFELTQDYRIVLPLLGAVGLSSWITSGYTKREGGDDAKKIKEENKHATEQADTSSCNSRVISSSNLLAEKRSYAIGFHECRDSFRVADTDDEMIELAKRILVSQAMRKEFATVLMSTYLTEAVTIMLAKKQSCAIIVDDRRFLIGLLTLGEIQEFSKLSTIKSKKPEELVVSELCHSEDDNCQLAWSLTPCMNLFTAQFIMDRYGVSQLPVILEHVESHRGLPVGLLDRECINLACRAFATKEYLCSFSTPERPTTDVE